MNHPTSTTLKNNWKQSMQSKSILIAIAALALTATNAHAFSGEVLEQAGLTESQRHAFEEARDLRISGDTKTARDVLLQAGIDDAVIERVRIAMSAEHRAHHAAMQAALDANDYQAFTAVVAGTPLADIITSSEDFVRFKEAHDLREEGDLTSAAAIMKDLEVQKPISYSISTKTSVATMRDSKGLMSDLTASEQEAFAVAKAANDRDAMDAILDEAGVGDGWSSSSKYLRDGRELQ